MSGVVKAVDDSPSDFNEDAFLEYDPTPYDGGFDIALTYGKPLPPSDAICYPRSDWNPNSKNLKEFSYGSVIAPYGQQPVDHEKPQNSGGLAEHHEEDKPSNAGNEEDKPSNAGNGSWLSNPVPGSEYDFWNRGIFSYGNGYDCDDYKSPVEPYQGAEGQCNYVNGMTETQAGYDSYQSYAKTCEDLFNNWLCPFRNGGDNYGLRPAETPSNGNQWNGTADYLFGFSYPSGGSGEENRTYATPTYAYEKHSHEQPHYALVEYKEPHVYNLQRHEQPQYSFLEYKEPYAYEKHSHEQPQYALVEYREPSWSPRPTYYHGHEEEVYTKTEYISHSEKHIHEEARHDDSKYSELSWFQNASYYNANPDEWYHGSKYGF